MDRRTAKELLHIRDWLETAGELVASGRRGYDRERLHQEAGDALMMKLGEAATRLIRADVAAPEGVRWRDAVANRNWLIHQYDHIDRELTWNTLSRDLPVWGLALDGLFVEAEELLAGDSRPAG